MKLLFPNVLLAGCLIALTGAFVRLCYRLFTEQKDLKRAIPIVLTRPQLLWLSLLPVGFHLVSYLSLFLYKKLEDPELHWTRFLDELNRWDVGHILLIARQGYVPTGNGEENIAFLPFYPLLIAFIHFVTHLTLENSGLLLNLLLAPLCSIGVYKLARLDYSERTARLSALLVFTAPLGYFHLVSYTENMAFPLVVFAFYFCRIEKWWFSGACALLAGLTRTPSYFLFPALCYEYFLYVKRRGGGIDFRILSLLAIPLSFAVYLGINYWVYGDPFRYLFYQKTFWHKTFSPVWVGLKQVLSSSTNTDFQSLLTSRFSEAVAAVGSILLVAKASKNLRLSYVLFCFFSVVYFLSTTWLLSTPRYTSSVVPFYFMIANYLQPRPIISVLTVLLSLVFFSVLFYWFSLVQWAF